MLNLFMKIRNHTNGQFVIEKKRTLKKKLAESDHENKKPHKDLINEKCFSNRCNLTKYLKIVMKEIKKFQNLSKSFSIYLKHSDLKNSIHQTTF